MTTAFRSGNNVIAFIGAISSMQDFVFFLFYPSRTLKLALTKGTTKESAPGPKFIYPFDPTVSPKSSNNPAAATVNAFYIGNIASINPSGLT